MTRERADHMNRVRRSKMMDLKNNLLPIITNLRLQKMGYKSIAFQLNELGYRTLRGLKWRSYSIRNCFFRK